MTVGGVTTTGAPNRRWLRRACSRVHPWQAWRRWVRKHVSVHEAAAATVVSEPAVSAFVCVTRLNEPDATSALCPPPSSQGKPVHAVHPTVPARLVAQLPNGVSLELDIGQDAMLLKAAIDALRGH
jgi:transposase